MYSRKVVDKNDDMKWFWYIFCSDLEDMGNDRLHLDIW